MPQKTNVVIMKAPQKYTHTTKNTAKQYGCK